MNPFRAMRALSVGMALASVSFLPHGRTASAATVTPVSLRGVGSDAVDELMTPWSNAMIDANTTIRYQVTGDLGGRGALVAGQADFAVSGMPLTASEQAEAATNKVEVISAPLQATGLGFMVSMQPGYEFVVLKNYGLPTAAEVPAPGTGGYPGPYRLSNDVLAKLILARNGNGWFGDAVTTLGFDGDLDLLGRRVRKGTSKGGSINPNVVDSIYRADKSASNFITQTYITKVSPTFWANFINEMVLSGRLPTGTKVTDYAVSEDWPFATFIATRTGARAQVDLAMSGKPPFDGSTGATAPGGGYVFPTSIAAYAYATQAYSDIGDFYFAQIDNTSNGTQEWIAPTPATITKAVAVHGETPLYDQHVSGAYPLSYVNRIFVRKSGMDIAHTNAIAGFIRYSVTAGQDETAALGDGRLSQALVDQALAVADQVVQGNCVGSDRTIVTTTGNSYLPSLPATQALGARSWCADATVTTTSSSSSTSTSSTSTSSTSTSTTAATTTSTTARATTTTHRPVVTTTPRPQTTTTSVAPTTTIAPTTLPPTTRAATPASTNSSTSHPRVTVTASAGQQTLSTLPLPLPPDGHGSFDRLSTMLMGAGGVWGASRVGEKWLRPRRSA